MSRFLVDEHWATLYGAQMEPATPAKGAVPAASQIEGEAQIRLELCWSLFKVPKATKKSTIFLVKFLLLCQLSSWQNLALISSVLMRHC